MRKQFLNVLIKKYPNLIELGAAVVEYHKLSQIPGSDPKKIETIILSKTFNPL